MLVGVLFKVLMSYRVAKVKNIQIPHIEALNLKNLISFPPYIHHIHLHPPVSEWTLT